MAQRQSVPGTPYVSGLGEAVSGLLCSQRGLGSDVGADWSPTIEAAAAGVATAALGAGRAVLMGVSAARLHNVVPRALGMAIVAVPDDRRDVVLRDRDGLVHFVQRDTDVLDAELMTTDLGPCLVTTPEQTVLDLAHRPNLGHVVDEARAAIVIPPMDHSTIGRVLERGSPD